MEWKDSNITLPLPKRNELTSLIEQNGVRMEVPAKKVFLKPGDTLNGVYYIAEGRTRHFMCAPDGAEKLLYTLSAGWFYGETPCVLHDSTGLFSKTEKPSVLYLIPMQNYDRLLAESSLFREAILQSYSQKCASSGRRRKPFFYALQGQAPPPVLLHGRHQPRDRRPVVRPQAQLYPVRDQHDRGRRPRDHYKADQRAVRRGLYPGAEPQDSDQY